MPLNPVVSVNILLHAVTSHQTTMHFKGITSTEVSSLTYIDCQLSITASLLYVDTFS